ncbi:MAG TPA: hypothetical protein VGO11_02975 [Chthoniobacteraceae bacterium]|jgi:hypothetical protein|nr:hypothetical protein [Chthoniobacteraceae bacterium]
MISAIIRRVSAAAKSLRARAVSRAGCVKAVVREIVSKSDWANAPVASSPGLQISG